MVDQATQALRHTEKRIEIQLPYTLFDNLLSVISDDDLKNQLEGKLHSYFEYLGTEGGNTEMT